MTPAARHAAAITVIDRWLSGQPVEAALTQWARASRFAGSGDREAVRDLVFRAVRQRRSLVALGGESGRGMLLGMARADGIAPEGWTGEGHAPASLTADEAARVAAPVPDLPRGVALDCPDWLLPGFDAALGPRADAVLSLMRDRAPVFIRVNTTRATRDSVQAELAAEGIETAPHPLAETALEVTANPRRLRNARAFAEGRIEMQDAASQAIAADFARHVPGGASVLDYCAGGGGKALALAASGFALSAHDIDPGRMRDLPARARRAGADITLIDGRPGGLWPAIFADAPCSGSGSWRRAPEAKWAFTPARLEALTRVQDQILQDCAALTASGGVLGYATCSLLAEENDARIDAFLDRRAGWACIERRHLTPLDGGDGFFVAILRRE
ncbi:MAG: RsmB/NOP family class I SAM-dependent RNA methyltransferase [Pararhodobacter sp.]